LITSAIDTANRNFCDPKIEITSVESEGENLNYQFDTDSVIHDIDLIRTALVTPVIWVRFLIANQKFTNGHI